MYTCGGRAVVTELSWSRLLEGMLQEREQSQKRGNILHFIDFVDRLK